MPLFEKWSFYVDCNGDEYKANDDDDANPPILLSVTYDGVHQVCVISEPAVSSKLHNPIMLLLLLLLLLFLLVLHHTSVLCQFLALNVVISMQFNLTDTGNTSSQN